MKTLIVAIIIFGVGTAGTLCAIDRYLGLSYEDAEMLQIADDLAPKYGCWTMADGGSCDDQGRAKLLHYGFTTHERQFIEKEEARRLIVSIVDDYLAELNSREDLKEHLTHHPFLVDDVDISIQFTGARGTRIPHPFITIVDCCKGCIVYRTKALSQRFGYLTVEKESYKEAVAGLAGEGLGCDEGVRQLECVGR